MRYPVKFPNFIFYHKEQILLGTIQHRSYVFNQIFYRCIRRLKHRKSSSKIFYQVQFFRSITKCFLIEVSRHHNHFGLFVVNSPSFEIYARTASHSDFRDIYYKMLRAENSKNHSVSYAFYSLPTDNSCKYHFDDLASSNFHKNQKVVFPHHSRNKTFLVVTAC